MKAITCSSLSRRRAGHCVVAGLVVTVALGWNPNTELMPSTTAEAQQERQGVWVPGGATNQRHYNRKGARLSDGTILVAGASSNEAQAYQPAAWTWSPRAAMQRARNRNSVTPLVDGGALVVGGQDPVGQHFEGDPLARGAERFDSQDNRWYPAGEGLLFPGRVHHVAVLLESGKILVAGGCELDDLDSCAAPLANAQLYDPTTNSWEVTGPLHHPRYLASAVRMADGRVIVLGGVTDPGQFWDEMSGLSSAEVYDPAEGSWSEVSNMNRPRFLGTATLLPDGRVLAAGNSTPFTHNPPTEPKREGTSEIFDPTTGQWGHLVAMQGPSDAGIGAVTLASGNVLAAGGSWLGRPGSPKFPPQIYDPTTNQWSLAAPCKTDQFVEELVLLDDGSVLKLGSNPPLRFFETPPTPSATPTETATPSDTPTATATDTATAIPTDTPTNTATNSSTPSITPTRTVSPTATASRTPTITPTPTATRQRIGSWRPVAPPSTKRFGGSAALMPDGRVLVVGGTDQVNNCCLPSEIYDPTSNSWTQLSPINTEQNIVQAQLFPEVDGSWLVAGGSQVGRWLGLAYQPRYAFDPYGACASVMRLNPMNRDVEPVGPLSPDPSGRDIGCMAFEEWNDQHLLMLNWLDGSKQSLIYDRKTWASEPGPLLEQNARQRLVVKLADGRLLVLGGRISAFMWDGGPRQIVEHAIKLVLDSVSLQPGQDGFKPLGSTRTHFMQPFSQLLALPRGGAVAISGQGPGVEAGQATRVDAFAGEYQTIETFDPNTDRWILRGNMTAARAYAAAQLPGDNLVLIAGGGRWDTTRSSQSADLLDLATGRWYDAGPMSAPRVGAASARLADGRILVIGGDEEGTAEVFSLGPNALPSTRYIPLVQSRPRR